MTIDLDRLEVRALCFLAMEGASRPWPELQRDPEFANAAFNALAKVYRAYSGVSLTVEGE